MKIAYLILAHHAPAHLGRLIGRLSSESSKFFVHIDRKSDIKPFLHLESDSVVFMRERTPVHWGDFSMVEAELTLIRIALKDAWRFERFVLLSGSDYPLRRWDYIERFFEASAKTEYIELIEMPNTRLGKPISRLNYYEYRPSDTSLWKISRELLVKLGLLSRIRDYRDYLDGLKPFAGSQWWALSRDACTGIMEFLERERRVVSFYKNTLCPDESFFQTVLGNSPLKSRIEGSLTYADWGAGGRSPATISERHLNLFESMIVDVENKASGDLRPLFARKFPEDSTALVRRLDAQIEKHEAAIP